MQSLRAGYKLDTGREGANVALVSLIFQVEQVGARTRKRPDQLICGHFNARNQLKVRTDAVFKLF